jgi:hypothetical protein
MMRQQSTMAAIPRAGAAVVAVATALHAVPGRAQAYFAQGNAQLTVEAFGNLTAGDASGDPGTAADDLRFDGALRLLGRIDNETAPDLGIRVVLQSSPEERLETGEASILLLSHSGRLEFGERMGLPDVLTGYAPNNFTFTSADFGPPSGPSLDPAGGLQTAFLAPELAAAIAPLTVLGFTASLAEDQSTKLLYVSPKRRGLLGGLSFSTDSTDPRFGELAQFGLTHERYWRENVFRWGGSYSFARGSADAPGGQVGDLHSANVGATIVIDDSLTLGASATFNGDSGLPEARLATGLSDAWGVVASINYNVGPWTVGAYGQRAQSEGDVAGPGADRLDAIQVGVSYRWNTHLRAYAAWFRYDFDDEGGKTAATGHSGNILLAGLRLAL